MITTFNINQTTSNNMSKGMIIETLLVDKSDQGTESFDVETLSEAFEGFHGLDVLVRQRFVIADDGRSGAERGPSVHQTARRRMEGQLRQILQRHAQQLAHSLRCCWTPKYNLVRMT